MPFREPSKNARGAVIQNSASVESGKRTRQSLPGVLFLGTVLGLSIATIAVADGKFVSDCFRELSGDALDYHEINFHEFGQDHKDTIIFIHGLSSSLETWSPVVGPLSKKYRVIVYDQRGHGLSAARGEDYSSAVMAGDLASLMDHLQIKRATILGHSMGARTAVQFAHLYPERVTSVVVEDMHMLGRRTKLPDNLELSRALKKLPATFKDPQAALAALMPLMPRDAENMVNSSLIENADRTYRFDYRLDVGVLYEPQGLQEDLNPALSSIHVPMLFLRADPDHGAVLFGKGVDNILTTKPSAKIVMVPGAGHSIHKDKTESFLGIVESFLRNLP